jgi:excisionase family DNA binding protein
VNDAIEPAELTLDDVAHLFGVSKPTIWQWVDQGTLPAPLWRRSEIQRVLDNAVPVEPVD